MMRYSRLTAAGIIMVIAFLFVNYLNMKHKNEQISALERSYSTMMNALDKSITVSHQQYCTNSPEDTYRSAGRLSLSSAPGPAVKVETPPAPAAEVSAAAVEKEPAILASTKPAEKKAASSKKKSHQPLINPKETVEELAANTAQSGPEEEEGIKIVQVTLMDDYEGLGDIIFVPQKTQFTENNIKGFQIVGNDANTPIDIVVQTESKDNKETIQFLDWNKKHPNTYYLNSELGTQTSLTLYSESKQIGHYFLNDKYGEDFVKLDINQYKTEKFALNKNI